MPRFNWTCKYMNVAGGSGSTYTITDIQSVAISWGLQNITDVWAPARLTIEGRNPAQFNSNPLKLGNAVMVEMSSSSGSPTVTGKPMFYGNIADIAFAYDFVTNGDTWRLEGEGTSARIGRKTGDATWTAGQNIEQATEAFSPPVTINGYTLASTVSAQTITDSQFGPYFGTLLQMEQGAVGEENTAVGLYGRNYTAWPGRNFGDGTIVVADAIKYDSIGFGSRAQNYNTKVIVTPSGLADQVAGSGDRVYQISTYDQTTSQAADLANYLNASLILQEGDPITISAVDYIQSHNYISQMCTPILPWSRFQIAFRGTLYSVYAIGGAITATPDGARFSYNLIPTEVKEFLVLDDTVLGRLDYNKLGF